MLTDHSNLKFLPWFGALRSFDALLPFYVIYTRHYGLSYFDIFITQVVFSITLIITDIPLGIYADLYNRKKSLIFGGIISCLGYGLFVFWPVFWGFVLGEMCLALAFAAFSGSETALLFETTKRLGCDTSYCEKEGQVQAYARYSEAFSSILGGFFASLSIQLPAIMTWLFSLPTIGLILSLHEMPVMKKPAFSQLMRHRIQAQMQLLRVYFNKAPNRANQQPPIFWILLYSALLSAIIINTFWLLQVFLKNYHVNYILIGMLCFIYQSMSGVVAHHTAKIVSQVKILLWILPLLLQSMVLFLWFATSSWYFPIFLIAAIVFGIKMPFIYNLLHRIVDDNVRASMLSVDSVLTRLLFCLLAPVIGWILDHTSFNTAILFLTIPALAALWIVQQHLGKKI